MTDAVTGPAGQLSLLSGCLSELDRAVLSFAHVHHLQGRVDAREPAAARPLLERALTIGEAAYGPDHPAVATSLGNLAVTLRGLGELAAARPLLERALTVGEAAYGPDHLLE